MWYLYVGAVVAVIFQCYTLFEVFYPGTRHMSKDDSRGLLNFTIFALPLGLVLWPVVLGVLVLLGVNRFYDSAVPALQQWYNRRVDRALAKRKAAEEAAKARRLEETKYFP